MVKSQQEALFGDPGESTQGNLDKRTDLDRLGMVYGELGFAPQSREELTYATMALDHRDSVGGFARRLNEVLQHQLKADTDDPRAALRSIVTTTKGYASTTKADKFALSEVCEELEPYLGTQNFLELSDVGALSGWSNQKITTRGLGLISRHMAVQEALETQEMPNLDLVSNEAAIAEMMTGRRVYEADKAVTETLVEADNRFNFWVQCLQEATAHTTVRPLAFQALRKLGVIEEN